MSQSHSLGEKETWLASLYFYQSVCQKLPEKGRVSGVEQEGGLPRSPLGVSVGEPLSLGALLSFPKVWEILNRILFPITRHVCSKGEMTKLGVTKGRVGVCMTPLICVPCSNTPHTQTVKLPDLETFYLCSCV